MTGLESPRCASSERTCCPRTSGFPHDAPGRRATAAGSPGAPSSAPPPTPPPRSHCPCSPSSSRHETPRWLLTAHVSPAARLVLRPLWSKREAALAGKQGVCLCAVRWPHRLIPFYFVSLSDSFYVSARTNLRAYPVRPILCRDGQTEARSRQ